MALDKIDWENGNIDEILGIQDIDKNEFNYSSNITNYDSIEDLKKKYNINILIDKKNKKIIFEKDYIEIGKIEPGLYSHNNFESNNHLYKIIDENERGKGLGYLLFYLYDKEIGFPNEEYSHTKEVINLLLNFGYKITGYVENGNLQYIQDIEYFSNIENYKRKTIKLTK